KGEEVEREPLRAAARGPQPGRWRAPGLVGYKPDSVQGVVLGRLIRGVNGDLRPNKFQGYGTDLELFFRPRLETAPCCFPPWFRVPPIMGGSGVIVSERRSFLLLLELEGENGDWLNVALFGCHRALRLRRKAPLAFPTRMANESQNAF
ncbi:hypothetical protein L345_05157, partial [Ophiophagus hannah]